MHKTIERYGVGIAVGSAATIGLLYLMQAVISNETAPLNEAADMQVVEIVRILEDIEPIKKDPITLPPPPPDEFPPDPVMVEDSFDESSWGEPIEYVVEDVDTGIGALWHNQDGEYLPLRKAIPKYPPRALQRGLEGYVILVFTVTENGSVVDPVVEKADPPGIFDRAAIQAALQFKYRPRVVDGEAIRVPGVKHKITFELED